VADRLRERYRQGDTVEIHFADDPIGRWFVGQIVAIEDPGLWVALEDGTRWFVTNGRRIRPASSRE
jgi:hypothetical protein